MVNLINEVVGQPKSSRRRVAPLGHDFALHQLTEGRMIPEFAAEFYRRSGGIHVLGLNELGSISMASLTAGPESRTRPRLFG